VVVLLTLVASVVPIGAHHSVTGQFDVSKTITLQGTIARVDWVNPHAYVFLDVPAGDGRSTSWALSTIPIAMLRKAGITSQSLFGKPGEVVTVRAHPALNGKTLGWVTRITYSDGHYYALFE
jgi:hypothetical protein